MERYLSVPLRANVRVHVRARDGGGAERRAAQGGDHHLGITVTMYIIMYACARRMHLSVRERGRGRVHARRERASTNCVSLCIYTYVYMYVCMRVCRYVCVYVRVHVSAPFLSARVRACVSVCGRTLAVQARDRQMCIPTCMNVCVCTCTETHVPVQIWTHFSMRVRESA
jgi:hypothetical protein